MVADFWIKAIQLILSLSLLVFVHELGHFMFARLFKVRVEKFYLFFNWKFSLVKFKKIKGKWQVKFFTKNEPEHLKLLLDEQGNPKLDKKGNQIFVPASTDNLSDDDWRKYPETTEWGIGWVPLGGYCKIAGMVDESMDTASMNTEPQSWEYRSRPAWQRLFIIIGGVLMNFITAIIVYSMILFVWGKELLPVDSAYLGYDYCQTALNNGFKNGDKILTINGDKIVSEKDVVEKIVLEGKSNVLLQRNGNDSLLVLPTDFGEQMLNAEESQFMTLRVPFVVDSVVGQNITVLQSGDSIVGFNGQPMASYTDLITTFSLHKNEKVLLSFVRNDVLLQDSVMLDEDGKIGVIIKNPISYFKTVREEYGFFASFPAGWNLGLETLGSYVKQFRLVFTKAGAKSLGGFAAIGNLFPAMWDWNLFWNMTALLSIILAFMNILPIPILDGGYVLFLLYEIITRRKPSDRFMEIALNIGMFLLLALLIFANGNDIIRFFK